MKKQPIIIQPISANSSSYCKTLVYKAAFHFIDLKRAKRDFFGVSLLDDRKDIWREDVDNVIRMNSDETILFSEKEKLIKLVS